MYWSESGVENNIFRFNQTKSRYKKNNNGPKEVSWWSSLNHGYDLNVCCTSFLFRLFFKLKKSKVGPKRVPCGTPKNQYCATITIVFIVYNQIPMWTYKVVLVYASLKTNSQTEKDLWVFNTKINNKECNNRNLARMTVFQIKFLLILFLEM